MKYINAHPNHHIISDIAAIVCASFIADTASADTTVMDGSAIHYMAMADAYNTHALKKTSSSGHPIKQQ